MINDKLIVRHLGERDYVSVWQEMQAFTLARDASSTDEIWLVQHPAVFTQGLNGKPEHVVNPGGILRHNRALTVIGHAARLDD